MRGTRLYTYLVRHTIHKHSLTKSLFIPPSLEKCGDERERERMRKREGENSGRFCWKNEKLWGLSWVESFVPFVALGHFPELKPAKRKTFFLVWGTIESFFPPLLTNASDWPDRTKQKCNEHLLNRIIFEWIELKTFGTITNVTLHHRKSVRLLRVQTTFLRQTLRRILRLSAAAPPKINFVSSTSSSSAGNKKKKKNLPGFLSATRPPLLLLLLLILSQWT